VLTVSNLKLSFGERVLFQDVNLKFTPGNCYGLIGANGSGKSTFINILSGEIEQDSGDVFISTGERMTVLQQDHFAYDDFSVLNAVIKGHKKLYDIMIEKDSLYSKEDFTEEDGIRASVLEGEFADMGGWEAENEASSLLSGLGVQEDLFEKKMGDLDDTVKVRILLAQALFGNPDILLLDEPTNHLDIESITWLENFLYRFQNTVLVVSHDRHFLNKVCTHITDIDYGNVMMYVGNYEFWYMASQLSARQRKDQAKKQEDKASELKAFIQRFSSNASKARQATSRKKELEKLNLNELPRTTRRFPYVAFKPERSLGKNVLELSGISYKSEEEQLLKDFSLVVEPGDKIAFVGPNNMKKTCLFEILNKKLEKQEGEIAWGQTTSYTYFPKDNTDYFDSDIDMSSWLMQYTNSDDEGYIRGFLGRMLFSGDESLKSVKVLSGGEKVRCLLSMMMLSEANVLMFDEPTAHLDLESITSLNNGLIEFDGVILFNSHDHQFVNTVANRIIEFTPSGIIDRRMPFDDYLANEDIKKLRDEHYGGTHQRVAL